MRKSLEKELVELGIEMNVDQFKDLLVELKAVHSIQWTIDDLVQHPDEAKEYCSLVCSRLGKSVPDDFILRRLMNLRKAKELSDD